MNFSNQTVLITGAAGALGQATATAFRKAGATLALIDINKTALEQVFGSASDKLHLAAVDLNNQTALEDAVRAILGKTGAISIVCNIAGGFRMGYPVHETPEDVWRHLLDLNAGSIVNVSRAVVPHMRKAHGGAIVNVAAMAALRGAAQMAAYSVSKAAVMRLTESMAAELGPEGIRVNCVLPSTMDTPANRTDMPGVSPGAWVPTSAVADVICFLASASARGIQGAAIPVEYPSLHYQTGPD
jgi:NAD(P)-dependent dehydrogenase (short-subunit alcohol dehydrogenase family)